MRRVVGLREPAAAVAGLAAAQAVALQEVAADALLDTVGDGEDVPDDLVEAAVVSMANTARGAAAVGPSSAPTGSAAVAVSSSNPAAGSSRDVVAPGPAEHSLDDEEKEGAEDAREPWVKPWMDLVNTLADRFKDIDLQHDSDWAEVARDRVEKSAVEDGEAPSRRGSRVVSTTGLTKKNRSTLEERSLPRQDDRASLIRSPTAVSLRRCLRRWRRTADRRRQHLHRGVRWS